MTARGWHPFDVVARVLAERLRGRGPSAELQAAITGTADWEGVVGQASEQFVLAAFAAAVRDLGLARALEPELREFLAAVHGANAERNAALRNQLAEMVTALNRIGVEPVLLKGAIRLVDGLYPDIGWRMMRDLDVLVPEARLADAVGALRAAGYDPEEHPVSGAEARGLDHHHYPDLVRPDRPAAVEIHRELFRTPRRRRLLRAADVLDGSQPVRLEGATVRLPSPEHQLVHLVGHCQLSNRGHVYGRIELRDRLEAATLVRSAPAGFDWEAVFARFTAAGYRRPLLTFLLALGDGRFCAAPLPNRVDPLTRLQAHRVARQARSVVLTRAGWYAASFGKQIMKKAEQRIAALTSKDAQQDPGRDGGRSKA